jgi:hypothetical protein
MTTSAQERGNAPDRPSVEQERTPEKERLPAPNVGGPLWHEATDAERFR